MHAFFHLFVYEIKKIYEEMNYFVGKTSEESRINENIVSTLAWCKVRGLETQSWFIIFAASSSKSRETHLETLSNFYLTLPPFTRFHHLFPLTILFDFWAEIIFGCIHSFGIIRNRREKSCFANVEKRTRIIGRGSRPEREPLEIQRTSKSF